MGCRDPFGLRKSRGAAVIEMSNKFRKGLIDGLPIGIGYLSVSFAFGIFAVSGGLRVLEALLISMTNLTSAGQLAAVPIIISGGMLSELIASQFIINLRYALMSVSLSQKLDKTVTLRDRFLIAFFNTDEIFAVSASKSENVGRAYMYGLAIPPFLGWSLGTLLGALAGDILPEILTNALGIAIYGMFIAIVSPAAKKSLATAGCVLLSAALSCAFFYIPALKAVPSGFVIIICAVIAALCFALVAPINTPADSEVAADE